MKSAVTLLLSLLLIACGSPEASVSNSAVAPALDERSAELIKTRESLGRFFTPMTAREGDWLEAHPENGETFDEYLRSSPTLPTAERKTIYIQPIGKFTPAQRQAIKLTAEYMRAFYNLPVVLREERAIGNVPDDMTRTQYPNNRQIRTSYFIDDVLPKMLPDDAAALICLTSNDLYPGETWNYVFGQASLEKRVGVWSLWRLEKDNGEPANKDLFISRTLKIAMHETGHMFSMRHCTKYECLMSGTNHLEETDRYPLDTCPECTAKIAWAMKYPMADRYKRLAEFWRKQSKFAEQKKMLERAGAVAASNK